MSKYPLIKELGLQAFLQPLPDHYLVDAAELEAILQKAAVVYGNVNSYATAWTKGAIMGDTHSALLINIKQIKDKTTLEIVYDIVDQSTDQRDALRKIKKLIEQGNK